MTALKRERYEMPDFIREAIERRGLMSAYRARPDYQQNDYIRWISDAKRPATRQKRLAQMLEELDNGEAYMRMRWHPR